MGHPSLEPGGSDSLGLNEGLCGVVSVAYPELVSGGVSKSHKCKWLVKVSVPVRVSLG